MNKKLFMLLFFLVLISISAVGAADLDDNNETIVSSEIGDEKLSVSNDVSTIDDLNEDDVTGDDAVLQRDVKSGDGEKNEILAAGYTETVGNSDSAILGDPVRIIFKIELLKPTNEYDPENPQFPTFEARGENMDDENDKIMQGTFSVYINGKLKANATPNADGLFRAELGVLPVGKYNVTAYYHDELGRYEDYSYTYPANEFEIYKANAVINIEHESVKLELGDSCPTGATLSPRGGGTLNYSINDTDVIEIVNDRIVAKKVGSAIITVSFGGNDNCNPAAGNREILVTVIQTPTWYVNGSKSSSGDGKSEATAFQTLAEALNAASNGDIVKIAPGTYTGSDNINLTVNKVLTFKKYGDGEAIFDAQGQGRILTVDVDTINIHGLTFKNGKSTYGGAIYFPDRTASNSVINATFINNTASGDGGAIYFHAVASNSNINATFINNTATRGGAIYVLNPFLNSKISGKFIANTANSYGGAIYSHTTIRDSDIAATFINNTAGFEGGANCFKEVSIVNIIGDFINNTARSGGANMFYNQANSVSISGNFIGNTAKGSDASEDGGAANYFAEGIFKVDIAAKFINNTGKNVIYITNTLGNKNNNNIHDSVFLNNNVTQIIYLEGNKNIIAKNNWFGNNVTNFNIKPEKTGIDLENWLFLNATANPPKIVLGEGSAVTLKLFSSNGTSVSDYDASKMKITFDVSQTLGEVDKTSASIGEEITYTAKEVGNATVTGKFETVSCTVTLTNNVSQGTPTSINISNSTVNLKVNENITAGATLTPAGAGNLTYNSSNSSVVIVKDGKIFAVGAGSAIITVSFAGNDDYAAAENKTIAVTVTLNDASVSVNNSTLDLFIGNTSTIVPITDPEGLDVTFTPDNSGVVSVDENGVVTALKAGNAIVKVSVGGDGVYALNTTDVSVTVKRIPTEISVANSTVDLKVNDNITAGATLTPADAGIVNYSSSNSSVVTVKDGKIKALAAGSAIITVSFAGNDKYAAAENKTIAVTVTLKDASISVNNATLDLFIGNTSTIVPITDPEGLDVTFTPDNSGVVSVDENGVVTALKAGEAIVKVSVGGDGVYALNTTDVRVTVKKIRPVISAADNVDMKVDDKVSLNATLKNADAVELNFTSSNVGVVTVNDIGELTAVGKGSAYITVSFAGNGRYAAAENKIIVVTVSKIPTTINADRMVHMFIKDERQLNAELIPQEAGSLVFKSGNEGVVKVSDTGKLTAVGQGFTDITISFSGNDKYEAAETKTQVLVDKIPTYISTVDSIDMGIGDEIIIEAFLDPEEAGGLEFKSNDEDVVETFGHHGDAVAYSAGTAKITVSFPGNSLYEASSRVIDVTVHKFDTTIDAADKLDMKVGDVVDINATLSPAEAGELNYNSSDESIVTVNSSGQITAVGEGITIINVSFAGNNRYAGESKLILVNVDKIPTSISADDKVEMAVGDRVGLNATLSPSSAGVLDYTSSDVSVVTVNGSGEVTAVGEGSAVITVKFGGNDKYEAGESKYVLVTVGKIDASISVGADNVEMNVGGNAKINASLSPSDAGELDYTSSDLSVVEVNGIGDLIAVGEGSAVITVRFAGNDKYKASESRYVLVTVAKIDTAISAVDNVEMKVGDKANVNASLSPSDAGELDYTSSDVSVVEVNGIGEITAVGDGSAVITVRFAGSDKYKAAESKNITVTVAKIASKLSDVVIVENNVTMTLSDTYGNPISGANISYTLNGVSNTTVSDANGSFMIIGEPGAEIVVDYVGSETFMPSNITVTLKPAVRSASKFNITDGTGIKTYTVDYNVGERGHSVAFRLTDDEGNPIVNATVNFAYKTVYFNRTTDENGIVSIGISTQVSGEYLCALSYLGDDKHNATFVAFYFNIQPKPMKIVASAKTFKASVKTKKYTITLKTGPYNSKDGKTYLKAGKKVTLKINSKTYTAKTNSKGQATFKITKLTKKGKYTAKISFKGDKTYKAVSKKVKITIK